MIRSFKDKDTEAIFNGRFVRRIPKQVAPLAARKLNQVHAAGSLDDLRIPPRNRLEALKGDRKGQHSIRINDQWRICFRWTNAGPDAVEIVDYH
ncbi:MAG: type II toxin-antitoxin system RelE/ParE family toxin [Pseudomonadota bacterium]